jgi:hypothetical protein
MFPISLVGEFEIKMKESEDVKSVLNKIEEGLDSVRATSIVCTNNKVTFRGGIFRLVTNWNILVPVCYGEIEVQPGNPGSVKYKFSCVEMLVITAIMVVLMGGFILSSIPISAFSILAPLIMWLWLFGMNYLTAMLRLPAFVKKIVGI